MTGFMIAFLVLALGLILWSRAAPWVEIVETTIDDYIRDVEDAIMRDYKLLALIQSRGNVQFNKSGLKMNWKVKYRRAIPKGYADMDVQTFPRRVRHKTAVLGWRAYALAEAVSKLDRLMNRGAAAIVNIIADKVQTMVDDMQTFFNEQVYVDGELAGNEKGIHGLESMFGFSGISLNQPIALPSDVYAGINTDLGFYNGQWDLAPSGPGAGLHVWPSGKGTVDFDFYSPLLVDYTNPFWNETPNIWANTCTEAVRYGLINGRKNKSKSGMIDAVFLERELYRQWVEKTAAKERLVINQGGGGDGRTLTSLGYGDTFNFEGAEITYEFGTPPLTGYGVNVDQIELDSMQERLFQPNGPYEHEVDKSIRYDIDFFGNFRFDSPRYFVKWYPYS
jgi:hypothetical protein